LAQDTGFQWGAGCKDVYPDGDNAAAVQKSDSGGGSTKRGSILRQHGLRVVLPLVWAPTTVTPCSTAQLNIRLHAECPMP
jgi:hypothetical protein